MDTEKIDGKEILYMDDIGGDDDDGDGDGDGETTRPLTAARVEHEAKVLPQRMALTEANDMTNLSHAIHVNNPGSGFLTEFEDRESDGKPHIGFQPRMGEGLSPSLLTPNPNELSRYPSGEAVLFPQPPITSIPDVNVYQHKKTLAQGMMDLALLSANANQLRYVLQTDGNHPYYYPSLAMIGASLFLQIAVGIGLIWNSRYNVKDDAQMCKAELANNWTVIGIFLVTILNVFISSFGVADQISTTATAVAT